MTNNKKEKLAKLDELVLDKMTTILENGDTEQLGDLSTVVNYLKANQQVEEKTSKSQNDKQKELIEKYNKKRLESADT